jgi:adenylate cyclase class 2
MTTKQNIEFEAKVLDINVAEIKQKLADLWATFLWVKNFRRYIYEFKEIVKEKEFTPEKWVRLRTDWVKTTLTIKEIFWKEIGNVHEYEIEVSDFDETNKILEKLGYSYTLYQENIRESYIFEWIEFEIDFWPKIPPYLEIEAKTKEKVEKWLKLLWLEWQNFISNSWTDIYANYLIDLWKIKELKF